MPALSLAALVLATTGCGGSSAMGGAVAPARSHAGSAYTLMQMNLCQSGLAGCYDRAVLQEAVARIREARPDAVTVNEGCRNDVALIARRAGYHLRFSSVVYRGTLLRCVRPGGRGVFGDAVLTRSAVEGSESREFAGQEGIERRRWLCVSTRAGVDVCTAHLNTRSTAEAAGNDAQCAELAELLARRAADRPVIFGGDVNRRSSCAPAGFWARTDSSAHQTAGFQQVYASAAFGSPAVDVLRAVHTDHDFLVTHVSVDLPGRPATQQRRAAAARSTRAARASRGGAASGGARRRGSSWPG